MRAWFKAGADFLLAWKPFHYDVELYVDMGVSYTFEFFGTQTLSLELGADLHLWGPDFSGTATIHLYIISFTVNFGQDTPQLVEPVDWETFKTSFLPKPEQICSVTVQQGLIRQVKGEGTEAERWIVNPKEVVLAVNSAVPSNKVNLAHMQLAETDLEAKAGHVAIAPMGIESGLESSCSITIKRGDKPVPEEFEVQPIWKPMPGGLWGKPDLAEDKKHLNPPKLNGTRMVENMLAGFELRPIKKDQKADTCQINLETLQYANTTPIPTYCWEDFLLSGLRGKDAWQKAAETVPDETKQKRDELIEASGLVNPVIDFGEPVNQSVSLAA